ARRRARPIRARGTRRGAEMRAAAVAMIMLVLVLPGCRQAERGEEEHGHAPDGQAPDHQGEGGRDARDVLRIEPDMLRDLRLTTARAEERGSVEGVSVLGDIGPDEDAYAVIASPIPARVVRLHAAPASTVHAGEPLVELQSPELGKARAELLATQARLQLALRTLARKRALAAERIAPRREVEEAEAAATTARADAAAAEAALRALGISGADTRARAHGHPCFGPAPAGGGRGDRRRGRAGGEGRPAPPPLPPRGPPPPLAHPTCLRARRGTARTGHHRARAVRRPARPHLHGTDHE